LINTLIASTGLFAPFSDHLARGRLMVLLQTAEGVNDQRKEINKETKKQRNRETMKQRKNQNFTLRSQFPWISEKQTTLANYGLILKFRREFFHIDGKVTTWCRTPLKHKVRRDK
jgi:hypothetical protein